MLVRTLILAVVSLFYMGSAANPLHRRDSTYQITGVQQGRGRNGSVPFRLEVRTLQKKTDQWNLYLIGLRRLMDMDQNEKLSFYQIAGIHGRPYIPWDNSLGNNANSGYCTHSSILFPTWHRPYLALYEQVLYNKIQDLVKEYGDADRPRYAHAAKRFRIPYWDWATASADGQTVLPDSIGGSDTVVVQLPTGPSRIANPLFQFKFHPVNTTDFVNRPFNVWHSTLRYPTSQNKGATSQNGLVEQQLENSRISFRNRLYNLFTNYPTYANFSNKAWIPSGGGGNYDSIESVHDVIHGLTGSGGHMGVVDYSAFDPIFFLHHTMIDRAFAMWQALYPDSWITAEATRFGTFTTLPGTIEDASTPLTPFHSSANGFFTSDTSRGTKPLGYTYPELVDWNVDANQFRSNVRKAVNRAYGTTAPARNLRVRSLGETLEEGNMLIAERSAGNASSANTNAALQKDHSDVLSSDHYLEYIANLRVQKYALRESFFIHIFLGDFTDDPAKWTFDSNLVGSHCVFVNANPAKKTVESKDSATDDTRPPLQVTGTVPLTSSLIAAIVDGKLKSLDPTEVEPYLRKNLHWRVTTLDDKAVKPADVSDLKVSVVSFEVTKARSEDEFPKWSGATVLYDITDGRDAGLNKGEPA